LFRPMPRKPIELLPTQAAVSSPARDRDIQSSNSSRPLSFVGVVLAAFVRGFYSNAAARQCLSKKHLHLGVDTPQVSYGATLHCLENGFLCAERKGHAFRSGRPASLSHNRSRIQGAGVDHGSDLPVANQDNEQIGDHGSLTFRIEGVSEVLIEPIESVF